jgi:hypothetical protein
VRIYIYAGTVLIAFLALAGVISIKTAIFSAFCGGIIFIGLIWTLVKQRKSMLLNIEEPEARDQAHKAMLEYLNQVNPEMFTSVGINGSEGKHQDKSKQYPLS